jgi:hypothetical protein
MPGASRREFLVDALGAGAALGAAAWVAPHLSSVALAGTVTGSPRPLEEPVPPGITPQPPPQPGPGGQPAGGAAPAGELPFTGANSARMAVAGGLALAAGGALVELGRRLPEPQVQTVQSVQPVPPPAAPAD